MRAHALLIAVVLAGCGPKGSPAAPHVVDPIGIKARFWEPASGAFAAGMPRYTRRALQVYDDEVAALEAAGAVMLGHIYYHKLHGGLVTRVGGTHYRVVQRADGPGGTMKCVDTGNALRCRARGDAAYTLEVYRVPPSNAHMLGGRLAIPPNWYL